MAGNVSFRRDRCKGCGLCITVCPKNIIVMEETTTNRKGYHPATVRPEDMEKCVGCASCAKICPDSIITVERF